MFLQETLSRGVNKGSLRGWFWSSSARDAFPGIAQVGLVLETYVKVTFVYGRREEDTKEYKDNSLYYVIDSKSVQHLYVVRVDEYEFYDRKG